MDNNDLGYKNIELLRHYLSSQMKNIEGKMSAESNYLIGCIIASLIDILIVLVFDDVLTKVGIVYKFVALIILIILFVIFSKIVTYICGIHGINQLIEGKQRSKDKNIEKYIDQFDNIACGGVLLANEYIKKYKTETSYIKEYYLYEILHYLKKSIGIAELICSDTKNYYVRLEKENDIEGIEKIAEYRIINFINISGNILEFLKKEQKNNAQLQSNKMLRKDIDNIDVTIQEIRKNMDLD